MGGLAMKAIAVSAGLAAFLAVSGCATTVRAQPGYGSYGYGGSGGVSVEVFHDELSPYGEWVYVEGYGNVWRPYDGVVGPGFRPYATHGRWIYTDYGWSFSSDFHWGWATFHYGRWFHEPAYGWVWLPGTVWAPAWVSWRYGNGYVGWAPLGPSGVVVVDRFGPSWCFVETRHFVHPRFYDYAVTGPRVTVVYQNTYVINQQVSYGHARWYSGPSPTHVATAVGSPIRPVAVRPPEPGYVRPVHITSSGVSYSRPPPGAAGGHAYQPAPSAPRHSGFSSGGYQPPPSSGRPPPGMGAGSGYQPPPSAGRPPPSGYGGAGSGYQPPPGGGRMSPPPGYGGAPGYGNAPSHGQVQAPPAARPPPSGGDSGYVRPGYGRRVDQAEERANSAVMGGGYQTRPMGPSGGGFQTPPPPSGGGFRNPSPPPSGGGGFGGGGFRSPSPPPGAGGGGGGMSQPQRGGRPFGR